MVYLLFKASNLFGVLAFLFAKVISPKKWG